MENYPTSVDKTRFTLTFRLYALLVLSLLLIDSSGLFRGDKFDGVARASEVTVPPSIKLKLKATPRRNNSGVINLTEGQSLRIDLKAINQNDPEGKDPEKVHSLRVDLSPNTMLPEGPNYSSACTSDSAAVTCGEGNFTWTPKAGDAERYFGKLLTFIAHNTYTHADSHKQQVILRVRDNTSPAFFDTRPDSIAVTPKTLQRIDISAIPGVDGIGEPHKLKIVRDPDTPLPKGARIGPNRKDGLATGTAC